MTTVVLILMALGVLALTALAYLGSWETTPRRVRSDDELSTDYRTAVREMRRAIADYERGRRPL